MEIVASLTPASTVIPPVSVRAIAAVIEKPLEPNSIDWKATPVRSSQQPFSDGVPAK
jgi:hypothetical protein